MTLGVSGGVVRPRTTSQPAKTPENIAFEFRALAGSPVRQADAQAIGNELVQIRDQHGRLDAASVVEQAQDPNSILHGYFTWDNDEAGELYRKFQARRIIRSITVRPVSNGIQPVRAFYNVPEPEGRSYRSLDEVLAASDRLTFIIRRFRADLVRIKDQYQAFRDVAEFAGYEQIFESIEDALENMNIPAHR